MAIRNSKGQAGFTLIELLIAIAIIGLLAAIAIPRYQGYVDQRDVEQAKTEILRLEHKIRQYSIRENEFPADLSAIGEAALLDPWDNKYCYAIVTEENLTNSGKLIQDCNLGKNEGERPRADGSERPVNSDYDLYSIGKDGQTHFQVGTKSGRDDILRANNGRFIGLGKDY